MSINNKKSPKALGDLIYLLKRFLCLLHYFLKIFLLFDCLKVLCFNKIFCCKCTNQISLIAFSWRLAAISFLLNKETSPLRARNEVRHIYFLRIRWIVGQYPRRLPQRLQFPSSLGTVIKEAPWEFRHR